MAHPVSAPSHSARRHWRDWVLLLFWPLYGLAFYALERLIPGRAYHVMLHPLDRMIPFCEAFVIPYVIWYFYMAGGIVYTFFRNQGAYRRVMRYYIIVFSVSVAVFFLYPTCQNLRPAVFPRDNLLSRIMGFLYSMDTNTNVCPSLHVSGAIGAALCLHDANCCSTRLLQRLNQILAVSICAATLFLKQHSVIDVFWGLVLSLAAWAIVYRKMEDPVRNRLRRGVLCATI